MLGIDVMDFMGVGGNEKMPNSVDVKGLFFLEIKLVLSYAGGIIKIADAVFLFKNK